MKVNLKILILLSGFIPLCGKAVASNAPTEEQVSKLVAAAWKEPPHSIDVTLYKKITKPPRPIEEIRQMFEKSFDKREGPKQDISPAEVEMRNRSIQLNVERAVKEQEVGRRMKQRIRIDGHRQRTDQVFGYPKMVLLEGTPHERTRPEVLLGPNTPYEMSLVNLGDKRKGDYTSFTYYHMNKTGFIRNRRGATWKRSDIARLAGLPEGISLWLKILLGQKQDTPSGSVYVADGEKLEKLIIDELQEISIRICPDANAPDTKDRIELRIPKGSIEAGTIMICDRQDYSRVYYFENRHPLTGQIFFRRQCRNFDSQGFPHNATSIQYDENGNGNMEVYRIVKVQLNPSIPDKVFKFEPPADYEVRDLRAGNQQ